MPLNRTTENWMKHPYPVGMKALREVAKDAAIAMIDDLQNDAEIRYTLGLLRFTENGVIKDRRRSARNLKPLTSCASDEGGAK